MKSIPPEIDRLIWALAEENNQRAMDEFVARNPQYKTELTKRLETVRGLRLGKATGSKQSSPPVFRPTQINQQVNTNLRWAVGGMLSVAIAFAIYTAYSFSQLRTVKQTVQPISRIPQVSSIPSPLVQYEKPKLLQPEPEKHTEPGEGDVLPDPPTPTYLKPKTVKWRDVRLVSALKLLAAESNLKLVIAPGLVDQPIDVDFQDETTLDILRELGKTYGFTPVEQGEGEVIVYPVRDTGVPIGGSPTPHDNNKIGG